jgi:hypothetical protein
LRSITFLRVGGGEHYEKRQRQSHGFAIHRLQITGAQRVCGTRASPSGCRRG